MTTELVAPALLGESVVEFDEQASLPNLVGERKHELRGTLKRS